MNDFLMIYITGIVLCLFCYGVLLGTDNAQLEDFGAVVPLSSLWPVFILPVLGVLIGAGLKKLWSAK